MIDLYVIIHSGNLNVSFSSISRIQKSVHEISQAKDDKINYILRVQNIQNY